MDLASELLLLRRPLRTLDPHGPEQRTLYLCFVFCGSVPAQFALSFLLSH